VSAKDVLKHVAAQLNCDYSLIRHDVRHVIDQYWEVFCSDPQGGDAEAEAAGEHAHMQPSCSGFGAQRVKHPSAMMRTCVYEEEGEQAN
jgi:hypothetical protein